MMSRMALGYSTTGNACPDPGTSVRDTAQAPRPARPIVARGSARRPTDPPGVRAVHGANPAYSTISVMAPDPTVRPPSRIAKRSPFSNATGVINSTSIATLSPGITISTPSGNVATPVTSVVRR